MGTLFFALILAIAVIMVFALISERKFNRRRLEQYTARVRKREAEVQAAHRGAAVGNDTAAPGTDAAGKASLLDRRGG